MIEFETHGELAAWAAGLIVGGLIVYTALDWSSRRRRARAELLRAQAAALVAELEQMALYLELASTLEPLRA